MDVFSRRSRENRSCSDTTTCTPTGPRTTRLVLPPWVEDTTSTHLESVLAIVEPNRILDRAFKVLLDSNHGAGSVLGQKLLEAFGCRTTILGGTPDGQFAHLPEPTAKNLESVSAAIINANAAIGFCQDPDADRLALIDETGRYVGEEFTLALCVEHILSHTKGPIVTNCSTSRMAQTIAERHGVPFFRSKVGEANVADLMQEKKAVFGGEGNGGPIEPRVGYVRDSFVGMALILEMMAERDQPLSELVDELPQYAIHKTTVTVEPAPSQMRSKHLRSILTTPSPIDSMAFGWTGPTSGC